jgi:signal transduction histidine kinase
VAGARAALGVARARLRRQVFTLRPTILEEAGLIATLKRLASLVPTAEGQSVEVAEAPVLPRLDPEVELGLYRIAQAAIESAFARGGARRVVVALTRTGSTVRLTVQDHGKPGPASDAADATVPDTMRDWAAVLHADLTIEAAADLTTVTVSAPA